MKEKMTTCSKYEMLALSETESPLLKEHLKTCSSCRDFVAFTGIVVNCQPDIASTPPLPVVHVQSPNKRAIRRVWYSAGAAALVLIGIATVLNGPQQSVKMTVATGSEIAAAESAKDYIFSWDQSEMINDFSQLADSFEELQNMTDWQINSYAME